MEAQLATDLLLSLHAKRLVIVCGAGLSIPGPSHAPSARDLAEKCFDKYVQVTGDNPPGNARGNLELFTEYLCERSRLVDFIRSIVDWTEFRGAPNSGHLAIAEFLSCKALHSVTTTNFDELIELAAKKMGDKDFQAALDVAGANEFHCHAPLVKLHGCVTDRLNTLWCRHQLRHGLNPANATIRERLGGLAMWLRAALPGKDVIFVGFWSDWTHINRTFRILLRNNQPRPARVLLVDPSDNAELERKAPKLFEWARSTTFEHVQVSGVDFLTELREAFSRQFFKQLFGFSMSDIPITERTGMDTTFADPVNSDDLYALKKDVSGVPNNQPLRESDAAALILRPAGEAHLRIRAKGAVLDGSHYLVNANGGQKRVRIIAEEGGL